MSDESRDSAAPIGGISSDIDEAALRARYAAEREKRLRADGNAQYREVSGAFAHFLDDPYTPASERMPIEDEIDVLVIGGGFGGLLSAARLRQAGINSFRIVEKGGDFGGTWYWNRYPGAACDIESYIYLPLLEEVGYMPTQKYAQGPEIFEYCRHLGRHFDLYPNACFQTEVTELRWDETDQRWLVGTNRGDRMRARFVVMANGPLQKPKLPGIPGIENFLGHSFHTSRWDYDYTGGDANGGLDRLKDKRVAIIGTGATAIQCIPHLGASAEHLYVFQRTPSSVGVRNNRPTDPEWAKALEPGWQTRRMENFSTLISGAYQEEDLVNDGWTELISRLFHLAKRERKLGKSAEDAAKVMQRADFETMENIRLRIDRTVTDGTTAESLKPWYNLFCKRPCFHDEYLPTFNRPNVTLVNTDGRGVERITEDSIIVAGQAYEVDCIVYSTGFEVGTGYTKRAGYEVFGRKGLRLSDKWAAGMQTLHSFLTRDFPNCIFVQTGHAGHTANFAHLLDVQSVHVANLIATTLARGASTIEPTATAEAEWTETIVSAAKNRPGFYDECTPGYYNNEGQINAVALRNSTYLGGVTAFSKLLKEWRDDGKLAGLEFKSASS